MKLYIAVLDEFPDYMTPTLVAHSVLGAHLVYSGHSLYDKWLKESFKKCVVKVNRKEFDKIRLLDPKPYEGFEKHTLDGQISCIIPMPVEDNNIPNVLKFAKLWKPNLKP
jgi:hypothetical protein